MKSGDSEAVSQFVVGLIVCRAACLSLFLVLLWMACIKLLLTNKKKKNIPPLHCPPPTEKESSLEKSLIDRSKRWKAFPVSLDRRGSSVCPFLSFQVSSLSGQSCSALFCAFSSWPHSLLSCLALISDTHPAMYSCRVTRPYVCAVCFAVCLSLSCFSKLSACLTARADNDRIRRRETKI